MRKFAYAILPAVLLAAVLLAAMLPLLGQEPGRQAKPDITIASITDVPPGPFDEIDAALKRLHDRPSNWSQMSEAAKEADCAYRTRTWRELKAARDSLALAIKDRADRAVPCAAPAQQPPPKKEARKGPPVSKKTGKPFRTGATRTPPHKIFQAISSGKLGVHKASAKLPASVLRVPPYLNMLGNDQYGDCVSAESGFSLQSYSVGLGLPEIPVSYQDAVNFAQTNGYLNGADLLSVIQTMQSTGMLVSANQTTYKAGSPSTVDFTNEATLQSAIALGPVSLGIDSTALPDTAGNQQGWYAFGGSPQQFTNEDHDVDVCGYGDAKTLFQALGVPAPANAPTSTLYLVYTWATIGVVDFAWIQSTAGEAYVRNPTVLGLTPLPPPPPPPPPPPNPPAGSAVTIGYPAGSTVSDNGMGAVTITIPAPSVPLPASVNITVTHNADGSFTVSPQRKGK